MTRTALRLPLVVALAAAAVGAAGCGPDEHRVVVAREVPPVVGTAEAAPADRAVVVAPADPAPAADRFDVAPAAPPVTDDPDPRQASAPGAVPPAAETLPPAKPLDVEHGLDIRPLRPVALRQGSSEQVVIRLDRRTANTVRVEFRNLPQGVTVPDADIGILSDAGNFTIQAAGNAPLTDRHFATVVAVGEGGVRAEEPLEIAVRR